MAEKEFPRGLITKRRDNAPDFVIANLAFKVDEFITYLQEQKSEWVNIDIKNSKGGKMYADLNDWKPENTQASNSANPMNKPAPKKEETISIEDIPF